MPEMDGVQATSLIRSKEGNKKHTPIIALTAFALKGDREKFMAMDMDEYISKPVDMKTLFGMLITFLKPKISTTKDQKKHDFNDNVSIGLDGEIIFTEKAISSLRMDLLEQIENLVQNFGGLIQDKKTIEIERTAHRIKELCDQMKSEQLKSTAFKIELAARRGNMDQVKEYVSKFIHEIKRSLLQ